MAKQPDQICLFYHPYSYYSQKVLMTLYEKKIQFETKIVDITKGEQYSKSFLKLNPKGEVPVLKINNTILCDSSNIIDYLENYYNNESLIGKYNQTRNNVTKFRKLIDALPAGVITIGSFFHPELCLPPKKPFSKSIIEILTKAEMESVDRLHHYATLNPDYQQVLLKKAEIKKKKHAIIINKDEYIKILLIIENIFDDIEVQLNNNEGHLKWLCSNDFTLADISLAVLLARLDSLGLDAYFWRKGKRKNIERYFNNIKRKPSFKKSICVDYYYKETIGNYISSHPYICNIIGIVTITSIVLLIIKIIKK